MEKIVDISPCMVANPELIINESFELLYVFDHALSHVRLQGKNAGTMPNAEGSSPNLSPKFGLATLVLRACVASLRLRRACCFFLVADRPGKLQGQSIHHHFLAADSAVLPLFSYRRDKKLVGFTWVVDDYY